MCCLLFAACDTSWCCLLLLVVCWPMLLDERCVLVMICRVLLDVVWCCLLLCVLVGVVCCMLSGSC